MLSYLLLVVLVATIGGTWPAVIASVGGSLALNWYFSPPYYTVTISEAENVFSLFVFLVVGVVISVLVSQAARRRAAAARAAAEAEALARVSGALAGDADPLGTILDRLRTTFALDGVAVLSPGDEGGWRVDASAGRTPPNEPPADGSSIGLAGDRVLVLQGRPLDADDQRVLRAFGAQLILAIEHRQLEREAEEVSVRLEADELRTALLRAVSHDLRTPLASIKASATSLLQDDVDWSPDAVREFLLTIDEEADRLNALVGNLLDMSRIETGSIELLVRPVGLEEIVAGALASIGGGTERVVVEVPETLPRVNADPALLERAVANVVDNALHASPSAGDVRLVAGAVNEHVDLRVIDRGPGVEPIFRDAMFEPFQRSGDQPNGSGVGLGLAVAHGFVEAMGGTLIAEDTPGGGLTMVFNLPAAEPSDDE
jgi:two-component system sensor histidine kinase KdpD